MTRFGRMTRLCTSHVHPGCVEIILCMRGDGIRCMTCGKVDILRPGEMFVAFPDEPHCVLDSPKGRHNYTFLFRVSPRTGTLGFSCRETKRLLDIMRAAPGRIFAAPATMGIAFQTTLRMCGAADVHDAATTAQIRHSLEAIVLDAVQACRRGVRSVSSGDVLVREIAEEIRRNPLVPYPLDDLCVRYGMSKSVLVTRFKCAMGLPPHSYLLRCRIELAQRSMMGKRCDLTALAHKLGFSSLPHFTRAFREVAGVPPRQWMAAARTG